MPEVNYCPGRGFSPARHPEGSLSVNGDVNCERGFRCNSARWSPGAGAAILRSKVSVAVSAPGCGRGGGVAFT